MRVRIFRVRVVQIVRRHDRQFELLRNAQEVLAGPPFNGDAVIHHFNEEVVRPKYVSVIRCSSERLVELARLQPAIHLT